jgi:hypothetical protein
MRDQYQQTWAAKMIKLLLEIKAAVEETPPEQRSLLPNQLTDFETRYDAILEVGLQTCPVLEPPEPLPRKRGRPKQHPVKNLLDHLKVRKMETLAFMYDFVGTKFRGAVRQQSGGTRSPHGQAETENLRLFSFRGRSRSLLPHPQLHLNCSQK